MGYGYGYAYGASPKLKDKKKGGGGTAVSYYWDPASANLIDLLYFNDASGDLTSEKIGDTYAKDGAGSFVYDVAGPGDLKGIRQSGSGSRFLLGSASAAWDLAGTDNFVMAVQFKSGTSLSSTHAVVDLGSTNATTAGVTIFVSTSRWDVYVVDNTPTTHLSRWTHGGIGFNDDIFYTMWWVFDRTKASADIYYKPEGGSVVGPTATTRVLAVFSTLGATTNAGDGIAHFSREDTTAQYFIGGTIYQFGMWKGTSTFPESGNLP